MLVTVPESRNRPLHDTEHVLVGSKKQHKKSQPQGRDFLLKQKLCVKCHVRSMAAQNILADLFSSFAIYFDKPFVIGDFVIVGDKMGVVEKVGIKTTRIRALQGEEIVMPNKDLTSSHIQNFKKMRERRVVFTFGVTYETKTESLRAIPAMVRKIIESQEKTRFDRAHFSAYGESDLTFEVVYYVLSGDYNKYMDIQQAINLEIKEAFERQGIDFAYPTRTRYLTRPIAESVK